MSASENSAPFEAAAAPRIVCAPGSLSRVGELARGLDASRALIVTDRGVAAAGHLERTLSSLHAAGLETTAFDAVPEDPDSNDVARAAAVASEIRPDLLVGLGGGSAMDVAKGVAFVFALGGRMEEHRGRDERTGNWLPSIAIPTTAGTGSEVQSFALIAEAGSHAKMACGDPSALPRVALLDPELTLTQPERVSALAGVDALGHALETWVTRARNADSDAFSAAAFQRLARGLPRVLADPGDVEARADVQIGATLAGLAIERSMLGGAHSMANALSLELGLAHGHAVGLGLRAILPFHLEDPALAQRYLELLPHGNSDPAAVLEAVSAILDAAGIERRLEGAGLERSRLPEMARVAAAQWTAGFNPLALDEAGFLQLFQRAW